MAAGLAGKLPIVSEIPFELRDTSLDPAWAVGTDHPEKISEGSLRTSSYTIYVDLPGSNEEMLLVHGYTGAYDRVSRRVAIYLRSQELRKAPKPLYGDWSPEPSVDGQILTPSDETIEVLKRRGYLTTLSHDAEEARLTRITMRLQERSRRQSPSYIIMPTYDCNLRCSYCFQDHMRTDSRFRSLLRTMELPVADLILAAMPEIEALHGLSNSTPRNRNIGFFGGEPLLESCRPVIDRFIEGALAMGPASFWAITNGTDLHAYRDLLSPKLLSGLQITIDGPPSEHNRRRIYADGSGTYERIARHIDLALEQGVKVSIRLNIDRNNIKDLPALARDFVARGWDRQPGFSTYTAPIRAENEKTDRKTTLDTWELDCGLVELRKVHPELFVIGRPDESMKFGVRRIIGRSSTAMPEFRESFCSAHNRMYIFDAFSDIYACWERTGDTRIRIGQILDDGSVKINAGVRDFWRSRTVASNPVCRQCRYALHCGRGCAVLAVGKTGQYHANYCDGFASRFRANVAEAYLDHVCGQMAVDTGGRLCDQ